MSDERNIFDGDNFGDNSQGNNNGYNNYGSNNYNQYNNQYRPPYGFGRPKDRALSITSLVTGILALICCCFGWTGIVFGAAAIATSIISRVRLGYFDGMSIAGLVLGIFGFVFGIFLIIFTYSPWGQQILEEYLKEFEERYKEMYPDAELPGSGI